MTRLQIPKFAMALLGILGTGGCALIGPRDPDDFTFLSVAAVYSNDRTDDTRPKYSTARNEKLLKIEFTTEFDLLSAAFEDHYNIDNRIDFCNTYTNIYSMGVNFHPEVLWNGVDLDRRDLYAERLASIWKRYKSERVHTFYVYLDVAVNFIQDFGIINGEPPPLVYNLDEKPKNVCLKIHGGAWIRRFFTSNVVVVPAQVIANALAATR